MLKDITLALVPRPGPEINSRACLWVEPRLRKRRNQLLDGLKEKEKVLIIERGSTRSQSVANTIWKGLWTCRKTDCGMYDHGTP